ncbi:S41 family peptidase [Vibrio sp. 99-70-13A1]|uniref:S41 family peptidase n=1 Tax=Vibrio sp. 99-70-13A1 TaxID=2607601 RepID=UPI00149362A2|nr:S41 family peptidase [Vibrio sp. 99-70-13A1]NOH98977.1 S41 family peptidase [Vibrio sp. 99-70-13A1]
MKKIALTTLALLAISGCNDSDKKKSDSVANNYTGIWDAPAYGELIEINSDSSLNIYRYTPDICWIEDSLSSVDIKTLETKIRFYDSTNFIERFDDYGTSDFHAPGTVFEKQEQLPYICQSDNLIDLVNLELEPLQTFDIIKNIYRHHYVDFNLKNINFDQLADSIRINLSDNSSQEDVAIALYQILSPLEDIHNSITLDNITLSSKNKPLYTDIIRQEFATTTGLPFSFEEDELTETQLGNYKQHASNRINKYLEGISYFEPEDKPVQVVAGGLISWFINEGIGYINIGAMFGYGETNEEQLESINKIMQDFIEANVNSSAVIIDVRTNFGGHDFISLAIAQYFTDSEMHVYSKQARLDNGFTELTDVILEPLETETYFNGPVYVLTSASTVSGAEVFALTMSALPNVTTVGELSQGAFSDVLDWEFSEEIKISIANERYVTPAGDWYEGLGVPVDIYVPFFEFIPDSVDEPIDPAIAAVIADLTN